MTALSTWATHQSGRCTHGFAAAQHPRFCACREMSEWAIFVAAVRAVARPDGTVSQNDVRPRIRGRIEPKHIGSLYRRARSTGLLVDTGEKEPSTDVAGRNTDKEARIYRLAHVPAALPLAHTKGG